MPDISALDKFPCAACGAQAQWNPAKQLLVCPFCGIGGAVHDQRRDRRDRGARSRQGAARAARRGRAAGRPRSAPFSARAARPCRSSIPSASARTATSAARRRSSTTRRSRRRSGRRACCRSRSPTRSVREQIRKWYASKWLAPGKLKSRALVDRVHGVYIPYWTFDAHVVCPWDGRRRALLLHDRDLPGRRAHPDAPGPARALGAGLGRGPAFLRRRAGAGDARRLARAAGAGRAVSDQGAACRTTRRFCRASSSSTIRSCSSTPPSGPRTR